jgi:hypothetical protein
MTTTEQTKSKTIQVNGVSVTCHSDGSVTLIDKRTGKPRRSFGANQNCGYKFRYVNGKNMLVHLLVAEAFYGKKPEGYDVDHKNGNRSDNRPSNLRYATRSQNMRGFQGTRGASKYRGVSINGKNWSAQVLKNRYGSYPTEEQAAERFDDVAFYEFNYPLEGLNFPQRILDKMAQDDTDNSMIDSSENAERIQTQIEMIRQESRILSYRIERMMEQRKALSEEKRQLKSELERISV